MKLTFILFAFIINFFNTNFIKAEEIIDSSNNQIENTTKVESVSYTHLTLPTRLRV